MQDQEKGTDENYGATVVDTGKIDCKVVAFNTLLF